MKTEKQIKDFFQSDGFVFAHKFYINALLFALDREDLIQSSYTDKRRAFLKEQLK